MGIRFFLLPAFLALSLRLLYDSYIREQQHTEMSTKQGGDVYAMTEDDEFPGGMYWLSRAQSEMRLIDH